MEKLGLSRQVTYHLIHTMHGTGIIRKNDSNRYVLGLATVSIAEGFSRQLAPPEHLARRVRSIVAATGETAYAGGWVDGEIVALATARGESPVGAARFPRVTAGTPMRGRRENCFWPWSTEATREAYLAKHPLDARTSRTITNLDQLKAEFRTNSIPGLFDRPRKSSTRVCSVSPCRWKVWEAGSCWEFPSLSNALRQTLSAI